MSHGWSWLWKLALADLKLCVGVCHIRSIGRRGPCYGELWRWWDNNKVHVMSLIKTRTSLPSAGQEEFVLCGSPGSVYIINTQICTSRTYTLVTDVTFSTCRLAFNYCPVSGPPSPVATRPWDSLSSLHPVYILLHLLHGELCPA